MKKFIYIILSFLSLAALVACEDFLDKREDSDGLDESVIYRDYESIRGYLDNVYNNLEFFNYMTSRDNGTSGREHVSVMADESAYCYNGSTFNQFCSGAWLITTKAANVTEIGDGNLTNIGKSYPSLRIVNRIISNIDQVPLNDTQRNEILGQAYFFRAWFYFQLIKRYGGMMKIDRVFEGGDDDIPRLTYHESSEWMVGDLDEAIKMLPDRWDDINYGRPTKLAAMAFREMALLYDASPLMQNDLTTIENHGYDKERAATAAKAAWEAISYMTSHEAATGVRMATADEYMNQFWFPEGEIRRVEHIWTGRYNINTTLRSQTIRSFWLYGDMTGQTGTESMAMTCPTLNAVNMYERKGPDGIYYPIDDPRSGYAFTMDKAWTDRDPRFYNNILIPGDEWGTYKSGATHYIRLWQGCKATEDYKTNSNVNARELSGFMCRKFVWPEANQKHTASTSGSVTYVTNYTTTVYIRATQLYLDFAEASFEATGSATSRVEGCGMSAAEALNLVRNRIGVTDIASDIVSSPDRFREAYRRERGVELMFENNRWWDVRRWMIMTDLFKDPYPLKGVKFWPVGDYEDNYTSGIYTRPETFTMEAFTMEKEVRGFSNKRNYWYPLPQHEVDALQNLAQNPGW